MEVNAAGEHFEMEEMGDEMEDSSKQPAPRPSFVSCPLKYDGNTDPVVVATFLSQIKTYKAVMGISDADALFSLPLVLVGKASVWWGYGKEEVDSWSEFERKFQFKFAPIPQPYQLYQKLVCRKQGATEETFKFITQKQYLFSQLPAIHKHAEEVKIDMIFSTLHVNIRKQLWRDDVKTFEDLISKARVIEYLNDTTEDTAVKTNIDKALENEKVNDQTSSKTTPVEINDVEKDDEQQAMSKNENGDTSENSDDDDVHDTGPVLKKNKQFGTAEVLGRRKVRLE